MQKNYRALAHNRVFRAKAHQVSIPFPTLKRGVTLDHRDEKAGIHGRTITFSRPLFNAGSSWAIFSASSLPTLNTIIPPELSRKGPPSTSFLLSRNGRI